MSRAQWILISGGSRGLGLALSKRYLERGFQVASFSRGTTPAVDELSLRFGKDFIFQEADALDEKAVGELVDRVSRQWGAPHALVNNAAMGQDALLSHTDPEAIARIVQTNLTAPILLTRLVVRRMLLERMGRIVNVSSICGSRGYAGLSVYSATKGAIEAFTRSLARELGGAGIRINAIAPGFFESEMSSLLSAEQVQTIARRSALGRLIREEDLFALFDLLLLEESAVTGQTFTVDGGSSV